VIVSSDISYEDRVVVITGAGRGMGRAHALELARRGAAVVVNDVEAEYAKQVKEDILADGGRAIDVGVSVATPEGGRLVIDAAVDAFGTVDSLVSNAGILNCDDFAELSVEHIEEMHATNLFGAWWVAQPAWRLMKLRDYGRIVIVGSSTGLLGQFGTAHYGSSKAGVWGLMKALACEAESTGIRVNLILPGAQTTIAEAAFMEFTARGINFGEHMFGDNAKSFDLLLGDFDRADPVCNSHMVAYLASAECEANGEAFTSGFGSYARAFIGIAQGWVAPDPLKVSAEAIRDHLSEIRDISNFTTPKYTGDELAATSKRIEALRSTE
jgi:NAD(P)-dependent dehydrogenase (short-subunit alcohol dehydrogenase family)